MGYIILVKLDLLDTINNPYDFTEHFSLKVTPESRTVKDFYEHMNCVPLIKDIKVPTLMIMAKNDPTSRHDMIPWKDILNNDNILYAYTPRGAHLEYLVEARRRKWFCQPMIEFLEAI